MIEAKTVYLEILKSITTTFNRRSERMGPLLARNTVVAMLDEMARNAAACVIAELPEKHEGCKHEWSRDENGDRRCIGCGTIA